MKKIVLVCIFIVTLIGLFFLISEDSDQKASKTEDASRSKSSAAEPSDSPRIYIGPSDAKVTIIEYIDYKCPNCGNFHQTSARQLQEKYKDKGGIRFELRQTPIIGPDSGNAARGAYCANDQNIAEIYNDRVFNHMWENYYKDKNYEAEFEKILVTDKLVELLGTNLPNESLFRSCVDTNNYNTAIDGDLLEAADDSIRGTPGFVINGQSFVGSQPLNVFTTLINSSLR